MWVLFVFVPLGSVLSASVITHLQGGEVLLALPVSEVFINCGVTPWLCAAAELVAE